MTLHRQLQISRFPVAARDCGIAEREQRAVDAWDDDSAWHHDLGGDHAKRGCAFLGKLLCVENEAHVAVENIDSPKIADEFVFDGCEFYERPRVANAAHLFYPQHNNTAVLKKTACLPVCRKGDKSHAHLWACHRNARMRGARVTRSNCNSPSALASVSLCPVHMRRCNGHNVPVSPPAFVSGLRHDWHSQAEEPG